MTSLFFFVLALIAAVYFNKRKTALWLLALLAFHLVVSGGGVLTGWALQDLQRDPWLGTPEWKAKNAIIVLGFGTVKWTGPESVSSASLSYARLFEGVRLYQSCKRAATECKLIVTGGDPMRNGESEGAVMARELESAGIPAEDIIAEKKSNNTFQNAQFTAPLLQGFERIYLVTSGMHMKRAMLYFRHFIKGIEPAPADRMVARISPIPISSNLVYFDFALHEFLGILRYRVYNLMGWNP